MSEPTPTSLCPACGAANRCALANDPAARDCWCMRADVQLPVPTDNQTSCDCPACLQKILQNQTLLR